MKKRHWLALLGCLILAFPSVACGPGEEDAGETPPPAAIEPSNVFEDGCYILADFETDRQIRQIKYGATFGIVTPNTDPAYVTRGKQSIRCEIIGREEAWGKLKPHIWVGLDGSYFQKNNFTDCETYLIDMYNAMDYDLPVRFCVENTWAYKDFTLKPGWNTLEVPCDYGEFLTEEMQSGFYFYFDRGELHEQRQIIYVDNFRARKKS